MLQNIFQVLLVGLRTETLTRTTLQNVMDRHCSFSYNSRFEEVTQATAKK